jgi:hypothetical protein
MEKELMDEISRRLATIKNIPYYYQEYLALGEEIVQLFPLKAISPSSTDSGPRIWRRIPLKA